MVTDIDSLFRVKMRCEGARAEVRQNGSDQNDDVARFNVLTNRLLHELSFVHANVGWLLLFECGFVHKHSGEGKSGSIHERLHGVLQLRTTGQDSWQNASGLWPRREPQ